MGYMDSINQEPNFKVGDKVVCIDAHDSCNFKINKQYTVTQLEHDTYEDAWYVALKEVDPVYGCEWYASRFVKAN